jgi:hypothetical protein
MNDLLIVALTGEAVAAAPDDERRNATADGNEISFYGRDFFFEVQSDISYTLNLAANSSTVMLASFSGSLGFRKGDSSLRRTSLRMRATVFIFLTIAWIEQLTCPFARLAFEHFMVTTMNGNPSAPFQYLGRVPT